MTAKPIPSTSTAVHKKNLKITPIAGVNQTVPNKIKSTMKKPAKKYNVRLVINNFFKIKKGMKKERSCRN
jgi:hypothetical protein